jgi:hypothetical protein
MFGQSLHPRSIGALAAGLCVLAGAAHAQGCSTGMLKGMYSLSFHGERLGLLSGSPPTLTPFTTPNLVDGVSVYEFDGQGNFNDLNFAMRDGVPNALGQPGLTADGFTSQTGTYHVNEDCTGAGTATQPGLSFTLVLVVGDHGRTLRYVNTSAQAATIPGNPNCTSGCDLALQVSGEGERIFGR